eukprot:3652343-Pyramimonas_sp.AAC.1
MVRGSAGASLATAVGIPRPRCASPQTRCIAWLLESGRCCICVYIHTYTDAYIELARACPGSCKNMCRMCVRV